MQPQWEVKDVLQHLDDRLENIGLNTWQLRTFYALKKCRTAALGGHIDQCDGCGNISISYNSCRNRHCPKCQGYKKEQWVQAREVELLPVPYFHVVFTLPEVINTLALHQPRVVYNALFEAAWQTLFAFGNNKALKMGMIAVLHTWGQNLSLHPHLHCIVPGGGVNDQDAWQNIRSDGKFLFSVKALSKVFRGKYCAIIQKQLPEEYQKNRTQLWQKDWVVYAKRPFGNAKSVVEYLGRYTHKIAISNHRLVDVNKAQVTFTYKDYKQKGIKKQMTLSHEEFIRRFALHILPKRLVKIRHYGFLSSTWKRKKLSDLQQKLKVIIPELQIKLKYFPKCTSCKTGNMHTILMFNKRGPPSKYIGVSQTLAPCKP
jgi:hypothetical protein